MSDERETYGFTWPGKREAVLEAGRMTDKVLRPVLADSVDFSGTGNIYIEGDNLEALKIIQRSYMRKVKMIYIDPPYNTGNEFIYRDDFAQSERDSQAQLGFEDEQGRNYSSEVYRENKKSNPRFHSDWCSMMYPRLKIAQNLLRDDGVIFVSIDDNEQSRLRMMCDEIFGENNFVACISWKGRGGRQDSKYLAVIHEYILCYAKDIDDFQAGEREKEGDKYPKYDTERKQRYKTQLLRKWGSGSKREDRPNLYYPITAPDGSEVYPMITESQCGRWRWGQDTMQEAIEAGRVEFVKGKNGTWTAYEKIYEGDVTTKKYDTWIDDIPNGTETLKGLFGTAPFDYSKSPELIARLMHIANLAPDSIVLDFFAGSSTTAHAVMSLNAQDSGNRKFILIQLPEPCGEKSEARKAGYHTICDIGRERIVRSGKWLANSGKRIVNSAKDKEAQHDSKALPGTHSVAESNESRQINLFPREEAPERGTVLAIRPDETGSSVNPIEHSGRTSPQYDKGLPALPSDSERLKDGTGDTASSLRGDRLPDRAGNLGDMESASGSRENASHNDEDASDLLTTSHYTLTTNHYTLDTGFRTFRVDTTNFRDVFMLPGDLTQDMLADMAENFKPDRSDLDLLFMCIADLGLPLSLPYHAEIVGDFTVHVYGDNEIVACFGRNITEEAMRFVAEKKAGHSVFRDSCFTDACHRINMQQIFETYSGNLRMTVI